LVTVQTGALGGCDFNLVPGDHSDKRRKNI
jgi:hypothetical protein